MNYNDKNNMKKLIKTVLWCALLYFVISNVAIFVYSQSKTEPNADTMIILGAQVIDTPAKPSITLQERLDTAINYLIDNPETKVIVCGGQGKNESDSEASVMKSYLVKQGIDGSRIYLEDESTRTAHQFIYAMRLMDLGKIVVVTSDFHMLRSVMLAKRSGVENISILSAKVGFDNPDRYLALWREPLALINSFLFDYPLEQ